MKRFTMFFGLVLLVLLASTVIASVPKLINFQGILRDGSGNPVVNSSYSVTFTTYDAATGGNILWTETQSVTTSGGLFAVLLGASNPVPDSVFQGSDRWLGIAVAPDGEMPTRQQLVSVGYAYRVNSVDSASGGTITSKVSIGPGNINTGTDAFVAGANNRVRGAYSVVSGGGGTAFGAVDSNSALGDYSVISGGSGNTASGLNSSVGGGIDNTASGLGATVSGGTANTASGGEATIGGGSFNYASGLLSSIGGGEGNLATDQYATVGGGFDNGAGGSGSTVGGGFNNGAGGSWSTVGGGIGNTAFGSSSTVGGGKGNRAPGQYSFVGGGGGSNEADSNAAIGNWSVVGGGFRNIAGDNSATVGGGALNNAGGAYSTVAGGTSNNASSQRTAIGGGESNTTSNLYATVGGGQGGIASGRWATIGGGNINVASDTASTVGGGRGDTASGAYATVPGGRGNYASGRYSLAAGRRAKAIHTGAFVWGDSTSADFASTAPNQFLIRADAVGIGTASPSAKLDVAGSLEVGNGTPITRVLSAASALDFPSTSSQTSSYLTITVTGAADGDVASLGVPNSSGMPDADYSAWISAANTVTVRFNNFSAGTLDPPSGTFRVMVTQF